MFYYIFNYLEKLNFPGAGLFHYISFRSGMAFLCALLISIIIGKKIIEKLRGLQIKETIRDLGLQGEGSKVGTPTMGGIIIIIAILVPTLLFAKIGNVYIILMIITTVWLGLIGFLDDYIKVFKKNKAGLSGKFKIVGQVGLGVIVASVLYMSDQVVVRTYEKTIDPKTNQVVRVYKDVKSTETTLPFIKKNSVDYADFLFFLGDAAKKWGWLVFLLGVVFIITAVSNGSNLTDGIDGLATGSAAIVGGSLGVLAYVSGNAIFANYLNIMHLPNIGELSIFISAFMGATIGFMWYNFYPAQIFMGDTGSLTLGGIIAVCAIVLRKELLLPIICGIFLVESVSVMMQVSYFKYTKKKYGEGRRIFLMSPLHHHFQKKGTHEAKITIRFLLIGAVLATIAILTLKVR